MPILSACWSSIAFTKRMSLNSRMCAYTWEKMLKKTALAPNQFQWKIVKVVEKFENATKLVFSDCAVDRNNNFASCYTGSFHFSEGKQKCTTTKRRTRPRIEKVGMSGNDSVSQSAWSILSRLCWQIAGATWDQKRQFTAKWGERDDQTDVTEQDHAMNWKMQNHSGDVLDSSQRTHVRC